MRCTTCDCQAIQDHIAIKSKPSTLEKLYTCAKENIASGKRVLYSIRLTYDRKLVYVYTNDIHTFRHFDERSETSMTRKSTCKNISEDVNLRISQKPSKYRACYAQIHYLMKRLSTALSSKLREGRPRKYYKRCGAELRPTNLCKPKGMPQEPSTTKQRMANTDKKERMETSQ